MSIRELQFALSNDHLMEFSESLLALMALKLAPELSLLIDEFKSLVVILGQLDLLPELVGQVGSLSRLEIQIALVLVL